MLRLRAELKGGEGPRVWLWHTPADGAHCFCCDSVLGRKPLRTSCRQDCKKGGARETGEAAGFTPDGAAVAAAAGSRVRHIAFASAQTSDPLHTAPQQPVSNLPTTCIFPFLFNVMQIDVPRTKYSNPHTCTLGQALLLLQEP